MRDEHSEIALFISAEKGVCVCVLVLAFPRGMVKIGDGKKRVWVWGDLKEWK